MTNSTLLSPAYSLKLAVDHQKDLLANARRANLVATYGTPKRTADGVRGFIGSRMRRVGAWIEGDAELATLTPHVAG